MSSNRVDTALAWSGITLLNPLWDELARRMSASDRAVRAVNVAKLDDAGRRTVASLFTLERVPQDEPLRIDVAKLTAALGLEDSELRQLVERLRGPLVNRARSARENAEARRDLWIRAEARLGRRISRTLSRIRAAGVPEGDVATHTALLSRLADVLDLLPAEPPIPLPMLAWQACGDPHGLDAATPCGRYLQWAALEVAGADLGEADPVMIRRCLRALGVVTDRLSTTTITYRLRSDSDGPLGDLLETAYARNVPVHISGAMLDDSSPAFAPSRWLCVENPSVVEHALTTHASRPLVCTSGWPSTDTQRLLGLAYEQGIGLDYAGDYDAEGLRIASWMAERYDARVLMTDALYRTADLDRAPLWAGPVPDTPWDSKLCGAIRERGRIVYQEDPAILAALLERFD